MKFKKNAVYNTSIIDINNLGYGVAKIDGMTVFVSGAVDGDVCDVKLIKVNKNYCIGIIDRMITPSQLRISPLCSWSDKCGGCSYQSIDYSHELEIKHNYVKSAFKKAGLGEVRINDTVSDMKTHGYRNKAQYPIGYADGEYRIGFYASKSHRIISADGCTLQPDMFSRICKEMKTCFSKFGFSVYDENGKNGLLRHLYLRTSHDSGDVMMCLVINGNTTGRDHELAEYIKNHIPEITTLLLNVNSDDTNVVLGDKYITLFGDGYIKDVLCGVELEIAPAAFYQVNHSMTERLYEKAGELAALTGRECVYDLYCGIGSIGLSMHKKASRIVGVDIEPSAIECARRNASNCGIDNARFFCADASSTDGLFESAGLYEPLDNAVVIFDPPRKGSSEKLIKYICEKKPLRVVYISCNPDTLARDCLYFKQYGYNPSDVTPFDLFPRTGHVESVVCLSRKTTHEMKLHASPFEKIKSGVKNIELRLFDEKRQKIKAGDDIIFTNTASGEKMRASVKRLHLFDSFEELYKSLPLLQCGYTVEDIDIAHPSDMEQYYSVEEQQKYGVVGIELFPPKRMTDESVVCLSPSMI